MLRAAAGRAFVDTEGLILHVIMDGHAQRRERWRGLVEEGRERSLGSGLIAVVQEVIHASGGKRHHRVRGVRVPGECARAMAAGCA